MDQGHAKPPAHHKAWARRLFDRFGDDSTVTLYHDDTNTARIPIFASHGPEGLVAATIGLMDLDQSRKPSTVLHTELMVHSRQHEPRVCNLLSTLAFFILKDGWRANPGSVFEHQVTMYVPDTPLPHILFTAPFQWDTWGTVALDDRAIHPLLAIPVSEAEANLATGTSLDALESLWQRQGTDVFDWSRESAA